MLFRYDTNASRSRRYSRLIPPRRAADRLPRASKLGLQRGAGSLLHPQPELDQAADGLGAGCIVRRSPRCDRCSGLGRNTSRDERILTGCGPASGFFVHGYWLLHNIRIHKKQAEGKGSVFRPDSNPSRIQLRKYGMRLLKESNPNERRRNLYRHVRAARRYRGGDQSL